MDISEIKELVIKAKKGDQAAIASLYEATSKAVYFTALKIVGNPSDAEDIAQDTYVTAISKLADLKDEATFPKWIKTIAVNTAKNFMIKKKPVLFGTDEEEQDAIGNIPEVGEDFIPDEAADKKETCRLVSEIIDGLPEKQRMAVIMFYYDEMTVSEIAEVMGTNDNTIKSRLNYARKQIKEEVEELAKKGTKLYCVAGVPIVAFVLKSMAAETAVPASVGAKAGVTTAATTATVVAASGVLAIGAKIAIVSSIAAASVAVVIGVGTAVNIANEKATDPAALKASSISCEWLNNVKESVETQNYKAFDDLYSDGFSEIELYKKWELYNSYFTSGETYGIDCTAVAYSEREIIFDSYIYLCNKSSWLDDVVDKCYDLTELQQCLRFDENTEQFVCYPIEEISDELIEQYKQFRNDLFTDFILDNGYVTNDYQVLHNKALCPIVKAEIRHVILDNEGLQVVFDVQNGTNERIGWKNEGGHIAIADSDAVIDISDGFVTSSYDGSVPPKSVSVENCIIVPRDKIPFEFLSSGDTDFDVSASELKIIGYSEEDFKKAVAIRYDERNATSSNDIMYLGKCTSINQANEIAEYLLNRLRGYVEENDFRSFIDLYSTNTSEEVISNEWGLYKDFFCNFEKKYEFDVIATAYMENEILYDVFYYCNYPDSDNKVSSFWQSDTKRGLTFDCETSTWKFHNGKMSDVLINNCNDYYMEMYGEKEYRYGYCSENYQLMYKRSLLAGVNTDILSAVINNDGSIKIALGIQNGCNEAKYVNITNGIIGFGSDNNNVSQVINLAGICNYKDELHNIKVPANAVKLVEVNIPESELMNIIDSSQFERCECEIKTEYSNEIYELPSMNDESITIASNVVTQPIFSGKVKYDNVNPQILKDRVDIYVTEAWYENGTFYTGCVVTNGFGVDKIITSMPQFIISDKNGGEIANGSFESVGLIVSAGGSVFHTFSFSEAAVKNFDADYSNIGWKTKFEYNDAYMSVLGTATQTIMGGKVKLTAEKKDDNTITLTIENNHDMEISTFGYPQVRVNGIVQDLDVHTQLRNNVNSLFNVPAGSKGVVTYYVNDIESAEALTGSMFIMDPGVTDKEFSLEF